MTSNQRTRLMAEWWPNACRAQGWPINDRAFRLQKLSSFVDRPLQSASDLDNRADIDRVKAALLSLTDDLPATQETSDPTIGEARRIRHVIRAELLPCLALYMSEPSDPSPIAGRPAAEAYLQQVITDLIRWEKTDRPTRPPTLDDLDARPIATRSGPMQTLRESPSQLHQAMMTLNARVHSKRQAARHTIHAMRTLAGLECNCLRCRRSRRKPILLPQPPELVESNTPF